MDTTTYSEGLEPYANSREMSEESQVVEESITGEMLTQILGEKHDLQAALDYAQDRAIFGIQVISTFRVSICDQSAEMRLVLTLLQKVFSYIRDGEQIPF